MCFKNKSIKSKTELCSLMTERSLYTIGLFTILLSVDLFFVFKMLIIFFDLSLSKLDAEK